MAIKMHTIKPAKGSKKNKKRVGRGVGSGHGAYATRGLKGQKARSGGKGGLKLKGFKATLKGLPKYKGMKKRYPAKEIVNLDKLNENFNNCDKVTPQILLKKGLIGNIKTGVKILSNGKLEKKLNIEGCDASKGAKEAIEKAGGKISQ